MKKIILLFLAQLFSLLWIGCRTVNTVRPISPAVSQAAPAEEFQAEPYYITPEDYEQFRNMYRSSFMFLGENLVILELSRPVEYLNTLRGSEVVSFTAATMPKDLQMLLQKYKMTTGEDFYSYVIERTDRFILAPALSGYFASVNGLSLTRSSSRLYPGENITFINTWYTERQELFADWYIARVIVHEAAHHELNMLILENKVSREYIRWNLGERYTYIMELEFLTALLQNTTSFYRQGEIRYYIYYLENEIKRYNAELGLESGDRMLLPRE